MFVPFMAVDAARFMAAGAQVIGTRNCLLPAIAFAKPRGAVCFSADTTHDNERAKPLPCQFDQSTAQKNTLHNQTN